MDDIVKKPPTALRISEQESARRREAVGRADAHNRIEGLFPSSPETTAVYEKFICGELEWPEVWPRIQALQLRL
jgi:hypothetical protein